MNNNIKVFLNDSLLKSGDNLSSTEKGDIKQKEK